MKACVQVSYQRGGAQKTCRLLQEYRSTANGACNTCALVKGVWLEGFSVLIMGSIEITSNSHQVWKKKRQIHGSSTDEQFLLFFLGMTNDCDMCVCWKGEKVIQFGGGSYERPTLLPCARTHTLANTYMHSHVSNYGFIFSIPCHVLCILHK